MATLSRFHSGPCRGTPIPLLVQSQRQRVTRGHPPLRINPTEPQEGRGVVGNDAHMNVRGRRTCRLRMPDAADRAEGRRREDCGRAKDIAEQAWSLTVNNVSNLFPYLGLDGTYVFSASAHRSSATNCHDYFETNNYMSLYQWS